MARLGTRDHIARIACATVWSDKRVGESYYDAAQRAADAINEHGMDAEKVLEMACIERADRLIVNAMREQQILRHGSGVLRAPTDEEIHNVVQRLRAEVGLIDSNVPDAGVESFIEPRDDQAPPRDPVRDAENRAFFQKEIERRSAEAKKARRKS